MTHCHNGASGIAIQSSKGVNLAQASAGGWRRNFHMSDQSSATKSRVGATKYANYDVPEIEKENIVNPSEDFSEAANPTLRGVLTKYQELIEAGDLEGISKEEWEKSVAESNKILDDAERVTREHLQRKGLL
jgi:hypothetical protein